jgi:fructose-bisphosphate aldolase / 6-deoxy-5-ketofructose 1-phosphate synthase
MVDVKIPMDVPENMKEEYKKNFLRATRNTGKLMMFAGDQKIEHLNDDFYGTTKEGITIPKDDADPEHLLKIASQGTIGMFATQLGVIAHYGMDYKDVAYLVKINSKSHLVKKAQSDPLSQSIIDFNDVLNLKKNGADIVAIGYTVYLGSAFEREMLQEAGRVVTKAHQNGLLAVLWMYPRGAAVADEKNPHLVAGAAGVALTLGADFAKVNYPKRGDESRPEIFKEAIIAAGRTRIITSGGASRGVEQFLQETWDQINVSGARGNATGRNIHQKTLAEAVRMTKAISAITLGGKSVADAVNVWKGEEDFSI